MLSLKCAVSVSGMKRIKRFLFTISSHAVCEQYFLLKEAFFTFLFRLSSQSSSWCAAGSYLKNRNSKYGWRCKKNKETFRKKNILLCKKGHKKEENNLLWIKMDYFIWFLFFFITSFSFSIGAVYPWIYSVSVCMCT